MGGVAMLTLTGLGSQLVGFLFRVLLTRMAGAEVLGLYQMLLPVYGVLTAFTAGGLTTGVSNLSARYCVLGNRRAVGQLRVQAVLLFLLLAVGPCLLLGGWSDRIAVLVLGEERTRLGLRLLAPCLVLTGIENLHKHYFYGTGHVAPAAVTELLEQVLRSGLCLGCLAVLRPKTAEGAVGAVVLGMALCESAAAVTQCILFRWDMGPGRKRSGPGEKGGVLRRQLGQIAAPLGLAAVLGSLLSSANALLIPRLLVRGGMEQGKAVAAYGVVFGMALPMLLVPTAFLSALGLVLTPSVARSAAVGDRAGIRLSTERAAVATNLVLLPSLALLAALGPALGQALCGTHEVGELLPLLSLGVLFSCWQGLFSGVLSGVGRQKTAAGIALACDGIQLAVTIASVSRWGLAGYAFSFALSSLLGAARAWKEVSKETGARLSLSRFLAAPGLSSALAASGGGLMETALLRGGLEGLPAALGGMAFGFLLYIAAVDALGVRLPRLSGD